MSFAKTFSLVGNLYESDGVSRTTRDAISAATYGLVKIFEYNNDIDANSGTDVSIEAASFIEFLYAKVDIPDGGDCTFTLTALGNDTGIPAWVIGTTYAAGGIVSRTGVYYASLAGGNIGNDPATDAGVNWLPLTFAISTSSSIVLPCNGGEIWINKTKIMTINVSTVSGCSVSIIGGSRT